MRSVRSCPETLNLNATNYYTSQAKHPTPWPLAPPKTTHRHQHGPKTPTWEISSPGRHLFLGHSLLASRKPPPSYLTFGTRGAEPTDRPTRTGALVLLSSRFCPATTSRGSQTLKHQAQIPSNPAYPCESNAETGKYTHKDQAAEQRTCQKRTSQKKKKSRAINR